MLTSCVYILTLSKNCYLKQDCKTIKLRKKKKKIPPSAALATSP